MSYNLQVWNLGFESGLIWLTLSLVCLSSSLNEISMMVYTKQDPCTGLELFSAPLSIWFQMIHSWAKVGFRQWGRMETKKQLGVDSQESLPPKKNSEAVHGSHRVESVIQCMVSPTTWMLIILKLHFYLMTLSYHYIREHLMDIPH